MSKFTVETPGEVSAMKKLAVKAVILYSEEFADWMIEHLAEIYELYLKEQK